MDNNRRLVERKNTVKKRDGLFLKIVELVIFLVIIYVSYYLSLFLDLFKGYVAVNYNDFSKTIPWLLVGALFVFLFMGMFNTVNKSVSENIAMITIATGMITVLYMAIAYFLRGFALPRTVVMLAALIQWILLIFAKLVFRQIVRLLKGSRNVMIIGPMKDREVLVSKILQARAHNENLKYFVDPSETDYLIYMEVVDKIYLSDEINSELKNHVITHCISSDKSLYLIPKTFEIAIYSAELMQISDIPMLKIESLSLSQEQKIIKRLFDLVVTIPAFLIAAPIMAIVSLIILVTEGRPVLYKQERVTLNNRKFMLYKFRSMRKDAEKLTGAVWAAENDPRVTPLGKLLRKFWLDELPQFFNILKGDMSLVGPRPERPFFMDQFAKDIPDFHYRLSVKAGVTGFAQVLGKYATTPENKIKFDLLYIKNASLIFDIKILLETVKRVIVGALKRGEHIEPTYNEMLERCQLSEMVGQGKVEFEKR